MFSGSSLHILRINFTSNVPHYHFSHLYRLHPRAGNPRSTPSRLRIRCTSKHQVKPLVVTNPQVRNEDGDTASASTDPSSTIKLLIHPTARVSCVTNASLDLLRYPHPHELKDYTDDLSEALFPVRHYVNALVKVAESERPSSDHAARSLPI